MTEIGHRQVHGFCQRYFNKVVLQGWQAVRLIGYGETAVDCYYICLKPRGERVWYSAVGGIVPLDALSGQGYVYSNGDEHWDDYTRLDNMMTLNGAAPVDEFICDIRPDDWEGGKPRISP